jgi:hypothetical protein
LGQKLLRGKIINFAFGILLVKLP